MIANKEYLKYLKAKPLHFQFTLYPFCIDFCTALLNNILDDHRKTRTAILQTLVEFIRRLNSGQSQTLLRYLIHCFFIHIIGSIGPLRKNIFNSFVH